MHSHEIFSRFEFIFRLKGTVVIKIWKKLFLLLLYTCAILSIQYVLPEFKIQFTLTLVPILGGVIGFFLVFRSNTAYARYWEGRCIWSRMTLNLRNITRLIWVGVKEPTVSELIEKQTACNLLIAFAYATKNYLREEYSYDHKDTRDLIKHLPRFSPHLAKDKENYKPHELNFRAHDLFSTTNIPIELSIYIQSYIESLRAREVCDGSLLWTMTSCLGHLTECLTSFERVLRTPMPLAYSVHLHHAVWLYLLALPFQLAGTLGWWTVAAVALVAFSFLGILEIGWEIENPFGYDDNDLPLDDYCKVLRREIGIITGNRVPDVKDWLWSPDNQPCLPASSSTAGELAEKSVEELRESLADNIQSTKKSIFLSYEILDEPEGSMFSLCSKSKNSSNV